MTKKPRHADKTACLFDQDFTSMKESEANQQAKASDPNSTRREVCTMTTDTTTVETRLRAKLLEHYADKTPNLFLQYDAWAHIEEDDFVLNPDGDGDCLLSSETFELMSTRPSLRVLIHRGPDKGLSTSPATKADLLRLLDKVRASIARESDEEFAATTDAEFGDRAEARIFASWSDFSRLDDDSLASVPDNASVSTSSGAERYDLVIGLNNAARIDPCAICGERTAFAVEPELFLAGTQALVCFDCAEKYAPELNDLATIGRQLNELREIGDTGVVFDDVDRGFDLASIGLNYPDWAIARRLEAGCAVEVATRLCAALPKAKAAGETLQEAFGYLYSGRGRWPNGGGGGLDKSFLYIGAGKRYLFNGASQPYEWLLPEGDLPF